MLDVVEIPGPTRCFLHCNQRRDRNELHGKPGCEIDVEGIVVFTVEVEGFGNEYVNRRGLMLIAEKVQTCMPFSSIQRSRCALSENPSAVTGTNGL